MVAHTSSSILADMTMFIVMRRMIIVIAKTILMRISRMLFTSRNFFAPCTSDGELPGSAGKTFLAGTRFVFSYKEIFLLRFFISIISCRRITFGLAGGLKTLTPHGLLNK